ncbi:flavin reductase family protein [soil metagenome]
MMTALTESRRLRNALGAFPTGVTVVTTRAPDGRPIGNTANSFGALSLEPPLILWSLGRKSYSLDVYLNCSHFAVNVLRADHDPLSRQFARALEDKWQGVNFETWDSGCPILPDALAVFECRLVRTHEGGDHIIFVGEVIRYEYDSKGKPLIFWGGNYYQLPE